MARPRTQPAWERSISVMAPKLDGCAELPSNSKKRGIDDNGDGRDNRSSNEEVLVVICVKARRNIGVHDSLLFVVILRGR